MNDTAFRMVQRMLRIELGGTGLYTDAQLDDVALRVVRDYQAPKRLTVYGRLSWRVEQAKYLLEQEGSR